VVVKDPAALAAVTDWGGETVGFVVGHGDGLAKDFCIYLDPHPTELKLRELRLCEDEEDLELEEPDYLFRVPFGICKQLLTGKLDPFEVLRKGEVRVEGDMKKVLLFGRKHQTIADRAIPQIKTEF
jgi:putative sterol carrier protein